MNSARLLRYSSIALLAFVATACATARKSGYHERGMASWYGTRHQGRKTANGESFDKGKLTAAHRTLPFGTMVQVQCASTHRQVLVRVNDRGPFVSGRIIDLSYEAARKLGILRTGTVEVELTVAEQDH